MTTEQQTATGSSRRRVVAGIPTDHRPWPVPDRPWRMFQSWRDLLFMHWPIDPAALRPVMPRGLESETFEGQAWVTVVPFWMSGVSLRPIPALPGLSTFPELNVRTYVTLDNKPGVYFFSLDAGNRVAVEVARGWYHLPYLLARMSTRRAGEAVQYASRRIDRRGQPAELTGEFRPVGPVYRSEPGQLDYWLTERYCLYAVDTQANLYRAEIAHLPWPLQPAEARITTNTMLASHGIEPVDRPPLLQFSRRLDVIAWPPARIG